MRNWLRPVPGLGATPWGRVPCFRKVKEIKGLLETVLECAAQRIPQIDTEIAEKDYLWMENTYMFCMSHSPQGKGRRGFKSLLAVVKFITQWFGVQHSSAAPRWAGLAKDWSLRPLTEQT